MKSSSVGGEDFQSLERTIVFGPQDSLQCVSIFIIPDNINEDQEVFSVAISVNDETAVIRVPTVIIAIIDDSNSKPIWTIWCIALVCFLSRLQ